MPGVWEARRPIDKVVAIWAVAHLVPFNWSRGGVGAYFPVVMGFDVTLDGYVYMALVAVSLLLVVWQRQHGLDNAP